jgi:hypothetical protein
MAEELKNFAMLIPTDIERRPDGSPVLFVHPEHKELFVNWAFAQKIDLEAMEVKEREELFKKWRIDYNIPDPPKKEWK